MCGRLEKLDTTTQGTRGEALGWKPPGISLTHLRKILERHGIFHTINTAVLEGREVKILLRWIFLGNLIKEMQKQSAIPSNTFVFCTTSSGTSPKAFGRGGTQSSSNWRPSTKKSNRKPVLQQARGSKDGGTRFSRKNLDIKPFCVAEFQRGRNLHPMVDDESIQHVGLGIQLVFLEEDPA